MQYRANGTIKLQSSTQISWPDNDYFVQNVMTVNSIHRQYAAMPYSRLTQCVLILMLYLADGSALVFASNKSKIVSPTDAHITAMGRFERVVDHSVRFGYPGVSFKATFYGKQFSFDALSTGNQSYLDVIVDDDEPRTIKLSSQLQNYLLVNEPIDKSHRIEIVHRSETWHGIVTIKQFHIDGNMLKAAALPKRKMLVLGDSVTCGEAIDRVPNEKKNTRWWNPRLSYGMLVAERLNAQVQLVCMGGHGLIRTWDGKTDQLNLPEFYQLTIADQQHPVRWDQAQYDPDLIVSAIGTNDFNLGIPERETYVAAYAKFLRTLVMDHDHAQIFLTESAILNGEKKTAIINDIDEVISRVGNQRLHHAFTTSFPGDELDGHPTKEQHAAMAQELLQQIREVMRW